MVKGWKLTSLYVRKHGKHAGEVYVSFCHYTGEKLPRGGSVYDETLKGYFTVEEFRDLLREHLEKGNGNIVAEGR